MNKNDAVIIAAYADEPAAEATIESLREWDKRTREVKLGVIGLVHSVDGVLKADVVHGTFGSFFGRKLPIYDAGLRVLGQELGNRVAVVVACDDYEAEMVSDLLVRGGGAILARKGERTAEEVADQEKKINEALMEHAVREASEAAKISAGRNINRPL